VSIKAISVHFEQYKLRRAGYFKAIEKMVIIVAKHQESMLDLSICNKDRTKRPRYNDKIKSTNRLYHNGVKILAKNPCQCTVRQQELIKHQQDVLQTLMRPSWQRI